MKIEWCNDDMTEAQLTRGNKIAAVAYRSSYGGPYWVFKNTGRYVGSWTAWRIDRCRDREITRREVENARGREWIEVPEARLIERKS